MERPPARNTAVMVLVYVFMFLGLIGLIVYLTDEVDISVELAMFIFFSVLGGLAYMLARRVGQMAWRIVAAVLWSLAIVAVGVFLGENNVHEGLILGLVFPAIGLLIYQMFGRSTAAPALSDARRPQIGARAEVQWDRLGERPLYEEEPDPVKRDRPRRAGS